MTKRTNTSQDPLSTPQIVERNRDGFVCCVNGNSIIYSDLPANNNRNCRPVRRTAQSKQQNSRPKSTRTKHHFSSFFRLRSFHGRLCKLRNSDDCSMSSGTKGNEIGFVLFMNMHCGMENTIRGPQRELASKTHVESRLRSTMGFISVKIVYLQRTLSTDRIKRIAKEGKPNVSALSNQRKNVGLLEFFIHAFHLHFTV